MKNSPDDLETLIELMEMAVFLFVKRPVPIEPKAAKHLTDPERLSQLAMLMPHLEKLEDWSTEALETVIKSFLQEHDLKLGKVAPLLRSALTGRTISPGIYDVMALLGKQETLARLSDQLQAIKPQIQS